MHSHGIKFIVSIFSFNLLYVYAMEIKSRGNQTRNRSERRKKNIASGSKEYLVLTIAMTEVWSKRRRNRMHSSNEMALIVDVNVIHFHFINVRRHSKDHVICRFSLAYNWKIGYLNWMLSTMQFFHFFFLFASDTKTSRHFRFENNDGNRFNDRSMTSGIQPVHKCLFHYWNWNALIRRTVVLGCNARTVIKRRRRKKLLIAYNYLLVARRDRCDNKQTVSNFQQQFQQLFLMNN